MDQKEEIFAIDIKMEKRKLKDDYQHRKKKKKRKYKDLQETSTSEGDENLKLTNADQLNIPVPGSHYTVSIAVPSSIVDNAQTLELKTCLIGQIARSAVIFCVDEIVVFTDNVRQNCMSKLDCQDMMCRILEYLECPQYLRKTLFPFHRYFSRCGAVNPLSCPSHLGENEESEYREGVVLDTYTSDGSLVDIGLKKTAQIDKSLRPGIRVTVKLDSAVKDKKHIKGKVVSHNDPRRKNGQYWSYTVREANSLAKAITDCPYKKGYDLTIGTSDKGTNIDKIELPPFRHLLIVFGGLPGLEACLEANGNKTINNPWEFFNYYLNTCPNQGSRTIRTEEAVLITLAALRSKIKHFSN